MATYQDAIDFLDEHSGRHTYGEVAEGLGMSAARGSQAVGQMMAAICRRGWHEYCVRVVAASTGQHNCGVQKSPAD